MRLLAILVYFLTISQISFATTTYAQLSSLATQIPAGAKGAVVKIDSVDAIKNLALNSSKDQVLIKESGAYFMLASGQAGAVDSEAAGYIDFWFNKNNQPVPNSNCRATVSSAIEMNLITTQIVLNLSEGDTISVGYSTNNPGLGLIFSQPENEPAIASFILSIFKMESL